MILPVAQNSFRGSPVPFSRDLQRIMELPIKEPIDGKKAAAKWTEMFRKDNPKCDCVARWGRCITELNEVQGTALEEFSRTGGLMGAIGVGHGKALALDTPIPTPTGWTTMGALKVGDLVLGSDGKPCKVTFATEIQYGRECFNVLFSDGSSIIADAEHRWVTRNYLERRSLDRGTKGKHEPKVRTTLEIRDTLKHRHNKNHSVDTCGSLELPAIDTVLDPYLLGLWLGDGNSNCGSITSADNEILEAFDKAGYSRGHSAPTGNAVNQYFKQLNKPLRSLGVLNNKHVPIQFLRASAEQRLALLQGLMDSDGYCGADNVVEFCNTNKNIADAVYELAVSLGQKPGMYQGRATLYGKDCGLKYRVCWQPTIKVFRLGRKLKNLRLGRYKQSQIKTRRYIDDIIPVASVPVRCITVDSPDNTYLCSKAMVPTHNTGISLLLPMVLPNTRVALLLIPALVRSQLLEQDYAMWSAHFHVPVLYGDVYDPDLPVLHVMSYSELSLPKNTDVLKRIKPDLVVADEAHNIKDRKRPRFKRLNRMLETNPMVRFAFMSGTLISKSIKDCAHLAHFALADGTPYPIEWHTLEHWSAAIDPVEYNCQPGKLSVFMRPGKTLQEGYSERILSTPGVVTTDHSSVDCSLIICSRTLKTPKNIADALKESLKNWRRPDGEELKEAKDLDIVQRQLALGFYYRMIFPHGEPIELVERWFETRQNYNREVREKLKRAGEGTDSPHLLELAARRYLDGDTSGPQWNSEYFEEWKAIEKSVTPETETCWLSDFAVEDSVRWLGANIGILWAEFGAFGTRVAKLGKVRYYRGGDIDSREIKFEKGDVSIVASRKANYESKNLQMFCRQLVTTPPSDGAIWEQLIGRTHRQGQKADEVFVDVYLHTSEYRDGFNAAKRKAIFKQVLEKNPQRLAYATYDLTGKNLTGNIAEEG